MARIREALRRADATGDLPPHQPRLLPCPAEQLPLGTANEEEIPFIEVGSRHSPIDGSASVLAAVPQPASTKPQPHNGRQPTATAASEVGITVRTISFCHGSH